MAVNIGLANFSGDFLIAALVIYSASVIAFAGDFAFGRPRRAAGTATSREPAPELALVGAGAAADGDVEADAAQTLAPQVEGADDGTVAAGNGGGDDATASPRGSGWVISGGGLAAAGQWVRAGVVLAAGGVLAQLVAVITRGMAVHRVPWGNMYEFVTALTCVAAMFFVFIMVRYRAWNLGLFVMGSVVIALGLAETVIYTAAGPLVPALQSYWLAIHVAAMTVATGIFFVATVLGIIYLVAERYPARIAAGRSVPGNGIIQRLPSAQQLDRLTYRIVVFGFPVWTFGVIAGAIWADQAWGRYWGWDPVETWAFITWVLYACYLHARVTAGWRGRRAHYVQLLGFTSLVFNIIVVQVFVAGLHSYSGVGG